MQKLFYLIPFLLSFSLIKSQTTPGDLILSLFTGSLFTSEALNVYYVIAYGEAYNDQGTGSNTDLTVWRPFTPPGFYNLGYVFQPGRDPPNFRTPVVQELTPGLLAEPTGWRMNWNDAGSGGDRDGSFWTPICPDGYFAVGSVAIHIQNWQQVTNSDFPDIRCVHCSLLDAAELGDIRWTDEGSGADMNAVVYNVADSSYFFYAGVPDAVVKLAKDFDSKKYMKPWVEENPASLLHFTVGDFDGDGKQDFISQEEGNPYANLFMRTRADDGFSKFPLPLNFDIGADGTRLFVGDFDGDKRDDFIRLKRDDMIAKVFLSDGDGTEFTEVDFLPENDDAFYEYAMSLDGVKIFIGDFNGDGKDDILRQESSAIASVFVSLGNGLFQKVDLPEEYQLDYESVDLYVGDFNGDKKSDFLGIQRGSAGNNAGTLYLSLGMDSNSGLSFASLYLPSEFLNLQTSNTLYIGDFNGDGKDDFLRQVDTAYIDQVSDPANTVNLFLSLLAKDSASDLQNDISTYFQAISLPDDVINDLQATKNIDFYVGDFDKDGKDDLIRQPTNLRWDSAIANIYLSSLTADNKPTFSKLPDIPLRGDFTPLYIGDFNGDGKSDILKQEKGTWGDPKFSLPTIYLALDDKDNSNTTIPGAPNLPFQKIYYRDELDASLIKDATTVKIDMIKKLEYGLTKLGNVMGYYTLPWENSYNISVNGSDTILEPQTGVCKFMSVRFMNWTFVFGDVLWGDALRTQQTIISTTTGSLNNAENPEPGEHSVEFSRSFTTSVDKYDLNTFTWNIGGGISTTSEASSGFYSQSITFEINFNIGEEKQTGTVSTAGETRTLTSSATSTVPPRSVQNYLIKVFGVQTSFDTSVVSLEARFSVMFSGGLRPDNYYNKPIGSDDVSNVTFTVGGISNPFYEALSNEIQKSRSKRWNWNDLMNQHPETYEWMRLLTSKGTYSTSQYFSLEAVEGTAVEVEFFPVK